MKVVDRPPVMLGINDRDGALGEPREILGAADLLESAGLVKQVLQRDRVGNLATLDEPRDRGVDAAVHRVAEMLRQQELGDAPMRRVVDENGPQQSLLSFDVGGRLRRALKIRLAQRRDGCLHRRQDTTTVASARRAFAAQAVKGGGARANLRSWGKQA